MTSATVRSKAIVLLLFIHCLLFLPLFVGVCVRVLVLLCSTLCPCSPEHGDNPRALASGFSPIQEDNYGILNYFIPATSM